MELSTILWIGGIAVSFVVGRKYGQREQENELMKVKNELEEVKRSVQLGEDSEKKPNVSAKQAFLNNMKKFAPLLKTLSDDKFNPSDWTDLIIDVDNDELTKLWQKVFKSADSWKRLLASWGISSDNCSQFRAVAMHCERYVLEGGKAIVEGQMYTVISKCWILTKEVNGEVKKEIILKGVVK